MPATVKKRTRSASKVAAAVANARALGAGSRIGALRLRLGIPRVRFARLVARTERAVIAWETGRAQPQGLSRQRVHELERLTDALKGIVDAKALGPWFDTPNPAFGGLKPAEVIERGESDRLWRMVFELKAGTHV
jgi:DNA-binding transcriptional regulator YiaG